MMANVNGNISTREEETALEWFQRFQQRKSVEQIPTDPISASKVFVSGKTGLSPIDMAWKLLAPSHHYSTSRSSSSSHHRPAILVLDGTIAKTTMMLSLAARFVVQTRPSQFYHNESNNNNENYTHLHSSTCNNNNNNTAEGLLSHISTTNTTTTTTHKYPLQHQNLPQVIILDSTLDITPRKLLNIVKTTLLRQPSPQPKGLVNNNNNNNIHNNRVDEEEHEQILENDLKDCLSRIHISHVDDDGLGWLPVLEAIRYQIKQQQQQMGTTTATVTTTNTNTRSATNNKKKHLHHHPTYLILWDGYNEYHNQTSEITKQISRLCEECSIAIVFATTTTVITTSSSTATNTNIPNIATTANTNNINNNKMMKFDWVPSSRSVHRIHLYQRGGSGGGKDCYAVINGGYNNKLSFSISAGGILS